MAISWFSECCHACISEAMVARLYTTGQVRRENAKSPILRIVRLAVGRYHCTGLTRHIHPPPTCSGSASRDLRVPGPEPPPARTSIFVLFRRVPLDSLCVGASSNPGPWRACTRLAPELCRSHCTTCRAPSAVSLARISCRAAGVAPLGSRRAATRVRTRRASSVFYSRCIPNVAEFFVVRLNGVCSRGPAGAR